MRYNVLYLDDNIRETDVERYSAVIEEEVEGVYPIQMPVNFVSLDPNDILNGDSPPLELINDYLDELHRELGYIDLFILDYHLTNKNTDTPIGDDKNLVFYIITHLRTINRYCSIILHSGLPAKGLLTGIYGLDRDSIPEKKDTDAENLIKELVKYNFTVCGKGELSDKLQEVVTEPTELSCLLYFLRSHHLSGHGENLKLKQVIDSIIKESEYDPKFILDIFERGISDWLIES